MSQGGNFSSNHTNNLIENSVMCSIPNAQSRALSDNCCNSTLQSSAPVARQPSMLIKKPNDCQEVTPADFAKYQKAAVPCSVRIQSLIMNNQASSERFQQYRRFQIPTPCPPLPASANMAGKSLPSSRQCNL
ncbi:MAG: hypothetical protein EB127_21205 [Alphaproteobacteria bacterium]|nr:hypothetical protein [Alphaproteobacteria bacterium]